jgi:hypothetical protein
MSADPNDRVCSSGDDFGYEREALPAHVTALLRHFVDLRDGTHGGSVSRRDKEERFVSEVEFLSPVARHVLREVDAHLLLRTGTLTETGIRRSRDGGVTAAWELGWPEQREAGVPPVGLYAFYGAEFLHPHLRGGTVADWPLNVFGVQDACDQLPILRAIATGELHNLVFRSDFRIIPAVMSQPSNGA